MLVSQLLAYKKKYSTSSHHDFGELELYETSKFLEISNIEVI